MSSKTIIVIIYYKLYCCFIIIGRHAFIHENVKNQIPIVSYIYLVKSEKIIVVP
jgi:hypothetical protein